MRVNELFQQIELWFEVQCASSMSKVVMRRADLWLLIDLHLVFGIVVEVDEQPLKHRDSLGISFVSLPPWRGRGRAFAQQPERGREGAGAAFGPACQLNPSEMLDLPENPRKR